MIGDEMDVQHRERMVRKKAAVDRAIVAANEEKGLLVVLTGPGKGKSSSAFGMVARALGHGIRVGVAQFIKGRSDVGEVEFFRLQRNLTWHVLGEGFTWETQDLARDTEKARQGWEIAREMLRNPALGLVVLDELTFPLRYRYLDLDEVLTDVLGRPRMQHVVITGRGAPEALVKVADTVTDMRVVKHAFKAGVKAQKGIDL